MVNVTIDGKTIEVPDGTTVLRAAEAAGVSIPTLCDHPHLAPYGGCRLCLVEVEGARTLQPSCTLPASNNMVVHTDTTKVREARKFVLTLIFSERNHFCMYCQKSGGDCELQNAAYAEGMTHWPLQPNWQPCPVDASHPDFVLDHNRCILCRRCVRACGELVGNFTLGFEERGARSVLVADLGTPLGESTCVGCGTCVQICPTGALIDRQSAYLGHETQVDKTDSICLGCSLGCSVEVMTRDNHLLRVDGNWDAQMNEGILCQAGRFEVLNDERERIVTPLVRKDGSLKAATWEEAFQAISGQFTNGSVAALASSRLPAEALYQFKQIFVDGLHSSAVASLEKGDVAAYVSVPQISKLDALKTADFVLVAGADLAEDHQVAGFFIKRNLPKGTNLVVVDGAANGLSKVSTAALKPNKGSEADLFGALSSQVTQKGIASTEAVSKKTGISGDTLSSVAEMFATAAHPVVVFGSDLDDKSAQALAELATVAGAALVSVQGEANSKAAAAYGLNGSFKLNGQKAAYLALGDDTLSQRLMKELEAAPFLVVQSSYISPVTAKADVVLPVEMWAEQEGHYANTEGRLQAAHKAVAAPEGVWSNEKVLRSVAQSLGKSTNDNWKDQLVQCGMYEG